VEVASAVLAGGGVARLRDGRNGHSGVELSRETHLFGIGTVAGTYIHYIGVFSLAGNRLYLLSNEPVDCGDEPCHGSKIRALCHSWPF
jgi:hypothetical protein